MNVDQLEEWKKSRERERGRDEERKGAKEATVYFWQASSCAEKVNR